MRIREYVDADRASVISLVRSVLREYGIPFELVGSLDADLDAASERKQGRCAFWVGETEGELIGTVAIRPKEGRTCELKRLYLRLDKRGSGLGQMLYAHAETFARSAGYERIWLDSSRRFTGAGRLYERNGFVLVEYVDNEWQDAVYEKDLG